MKRRIIQLERRGGHCFYDLFFGIFLQASKFQTVQDWIISIELIFQGCVTPRLPFVVGTAVKELDKSA